MFPDKRAQRNKEWPAAHPASGPSELGVPPLGVSGPHWKKKSCPGPHSKYIATHNHKKISSRFKYIHDFVWGRITATLGHVWPAGHGLDPLESISQAEGKGVHV